MRLLLLLLLVAPPSLAAPAQQARAPIDLLLPKHRVSAREIGVVVNDADPLSVRIANYYRQARGIPPANLVHVRFRAQPRYKLSPEQFAGIKAAADAQAGPHIQAWALTWAEPYRVSCMSITSAFAFGFDRAWCSAKQCAATRPNPWYRQPGHAPFSDHRMRPAMSIAALDFVHAKALIDRGVAADGSQPSGSAYLVSTPDRARNVRAATYARIQQAFKRWIPVHIVNARGIKARDDVLFYFTGTTRVPWLDSLRFVPGAMADHLTSAGGVLTDSAQMSSLRWLQAGATGSYGTVVEPCNLPGKFPHPGLAMEYYGQGSTLLEAYWKSVQQPGEGLFIGEPLAAPFDGYRLRLERDRLLLDTRVLAPGLYRLEYAPDAIGPYTGAPYLLRVAYHQRRFSLPRLDAGAYRIRPLPVRAPLKTPTATPR